MDPFVAQLHELCRAEPTRAKWVFVPGHGLGHTLIRTPIQRSPFRLDGVVGRREMVGLCSSEIETASSGYPVRLIS
jgi:hypothetical protein